MTTLAALIRGIIGSYKNPLSTMAPQGPTGTKPASRVKRFARWVDNATSTAEVYVVPYAAVLLRHLALQTLVVILDGSVVGRGCVALMMPVVYKGHALPSEAVEVHARLSNRGALWSNTSDIFERKG